MTDSTVGPGDHPDVPPRNRSRDARLAAVGIGAVLLVWFAIANLQGVTIRFWVPTARAPLIVVIVISGALGAALAGLVSRMRRRRRATGEP